ncbi:MAG: hypothetical protein IJ593_03110 [Lachnospiraceae bacterium]|nr:hypothetical protein [Lachnospiraceae bacterium]
MEEETSTLATESEIIIDIDKSSISEIKFDDTLPLFGTTPLFGDAAPDTIWLGTYPQSVTWQSGGSAYNIVEPIKWRRLSYTDTEALYIADKILDNVSYHTADENTTWADSGIHTWLNDTTANGFIGKAFTADQLDSTNGIIKQKTITTTDSVDTNDKAFLLSKGEAENLFSNNSARRVSGTEYAKTVLNGTGTLNVTGSYSPWWLRTPGTAGQDYAMHVSNGLGAGSIYENGAKVIGLTFGARPAIYINLESPLYKTSDNAVSWDLNGGSFANGSALWSSMNTYFGGQLLPTADNFTPPTGKYFIGMSINTATKSIVNAIIPDDQEGDIILRPLFGDNVNDKIINYDFGSGTFTDWSLLPVSYTPGTAKPLPTKFDLARYITPPADQEFKGFAKSGTTATISEIATSETTDINLVAIYGDRPNITWTMGAGSIASEVESTYISGVGCTLPSQNKVTPPSGYSFDHWILRVGSTNTEPATSIPANIDVDVEVIAVYSKVPSPYYPPGGGGGGVGGGGGGGVVNTAMLNAVISTTYINQKKFIKANVNSKDTAWVYDPIVNAFKMNITVKGQTVPAIDGFYLVDKDKNGSITDTYYFDKDGKMLTGWIKTTPDNKWYFLESIKNAREGAMVFGWYKVQNDWYYFTKEGSMLTNATTPDGNSVGPDGRWIH